MSLEDLEQMIENEIQKVKDEKRNLDQQIKVKYNEMKDQQDNNHNLDIFKKEFNNQFEIQKQYALQIKLETQQINEISEQTLKNFESLRFRKSNLETLINSITSVMEINRILPLLKNAINQQMFQDCIKYIKIFQDLYKYINKEFGQNLVCQFQELFEQLKNISKKEFENAIKLNQTEKMNYCSAISQLLNSNENSFEKMMIVYSNKLEEDLADFQEQKLPSNITEKQMDSYEYPFFNQFLKLLEKLVQQIDQYKENIFSYYHSDGLIKIIKSQVNRVSEFYLKILFEKFEACFELNEEKIINDLTKDKLTFYLKKIDIYCEEISQISNQNENFKQYLFSQIETLQKEHSKFDLQNHIIQNHIDQFSMNNRVLTLLTKFIQQQKYYISAQLRISLENSISYRRLVLFDKPFFYQYSEKKEQLTEFPEIFEFIDEIFFLAENSSIKSLSTYNKIIACGFLQHLTDSFFTEEVFKYFEKAFKNFIVKDHFSPSLIGLNQKNSVYNALVIVLFNNIEMVQNYLLKLKVQLQKEVAEWFQNQQTDMIMNSVENLHQMNHQIFEKLKIEQLKQTTKFLVQTMKHDLDQIIEYNFQLSEKELSFFENKQGFAIDINRQLRLYIQQWKNQFSDNNFQMFLKQFCFCLSNCLENYIFKLKFNQIGALMLEREIRKVINQLQEFHPLNLKICFSKLKSFCEILILENQQDMVDYQQSSTEISNDELRQIIKLRADL